MSRFNFGIIFIVFAAATVYFVVRPQWEKTKEIRAEIKRLQSLSSELVELTAERDALKRLRATVSEADLARVSRLAPTEAQIASFVVDLDTLAAKSGVRLDQMTFGAGSRSGAIPAPGEDARFRAIPVTLNLTATYSGLKAFLGGLERSLRLVDTESLDFQGNPSGFAISFRGKIYEQE